MSNDFGKYARDNAPVVTLRAPEQVDNLVPVPNELGQMLMVDSKQLPIVNPNDANYQILRYNSSGNISAGLQSSTKIPIQVLRKQGTGKTTGRVFLRFLLQNNNALNNPVYVLPSPFWIKTLEWKNAGNQTISTWRGEDIWHANMKTKDSDEWEAYAPMIFSNGNYEASNMGIPKGGTVETFIELTGNPYSIGEILTSHLRADNGCIITTADPTTWVLLGPPNTGPNGTGAGTAADLTLVECTLDFEQENADPKKLAREESYADQVPKTIFYPYPVVNEFTATLNANSQYTWQLSSFRGDVVAMDMYFKVATTADSLIKYQRMKDFSMTNSDNRKITGSNLITDAFNQNVQNKEWWLGKWMGTPSNALYTWVFGKLASTGVAHLKLGAKNGSFGMNGRQNIIFDTPPAGTNEVWTGSNSAAATTGGARFKWVTPDGDVGYSQVFTWNASTAALKQILEATPHFEGTVTFSAGFNAASFTITFGGLYANTPMMNSGYHLEVVDLNLLATATPVVTQFAVTTFGVDGMTSGNSFTVCFVAWVTGLIQVSKEGDLIVMNTGA